MFAHRYFAGRLFPGRYFPPKLGGPGTGIGAFLRRCQQSWHRGSG